MTVQENGVVLNEAEHTYTIDGRPAQGVTSAIEQAGLADWTFVHEFYRDRGSRAHRAVHYMVEHDLDLASCDDDVVGYVLSAERYLADHNGRTVSVERRVCSRILWCAGTLDWLGLMDSCSVKTCCPVKFKDLLTLLDWKTSQRFHPATAIQTIGYADMLYEETKKLIARRLCVLLNVDGGPAQHVEYEHRNIRRDRETFRAAVLISQWRRENKIVNLYKR